MRKRIVFTTITLSIAISCLSACETKSSYEQQLEQQRAVTRELENHAVQVQQEYNDLQNRISKINRMKEELGQ